MGKKLSNVTKLKLSNQKHRSLAWKYTSLGLSSTNAEIKEKLRIKCHYHNEVRRTQISSDRILSKAEKRAIYQASLRYVKGN